MSDDYLSSLYMAKLNEAAAWTPPDPRAYRVRAVLHHDDGLSHPDWGRLVAYDRRLSYHPNRMLAEKRRDRIMAEHGSDRRSRNGTQVKWVEIERRHGSRWELVERATPDRAKAGEPA